ncbi:uncharacterized protein LOC119386035 [Rhipicephalus sanguineus]|uniref:uncharacterized protein LOC119386035 n=1 Tax=Rhipicephalus sanguineus TaxID=34632 RepID=UPI0020C377B8|nr:uncharacterized protein LOC119386035 [Rhipicephalus sanguineus]
MDHDLDIIAVQETKVESEDGTESLLQRFTGRYSASRAEEDKATGEVKVKQRGSFAQSGVVDPLENADVPYRAWQLKWIRRSQLFEASVAFGCSPPHPYEFGYDSVDEFGNTQYRHETSDAHNNKRGSYGYTDANGIYRRVDYVADANGFRAHIRTNEPGTASSAPAGAVYDSKPVTIRATVIKSQRGGLLLPHDARLNAGKEFIVSPVKPHPAVVVPAVSFQDGSKGGHPTPLAPHPIATHLHGPPRALLNNDSPVVVGSHPTLVGAVGSDGHHDAAEVVATKVLTDPAAPHGVHATLGVVALKRHHHVHVSGQDYKAKSR